MFWKSKREEKDHHPRPLITPVPAARARGAKHRLGTTSLSSWPVARGVTAARTWGLYNYVPSGRASLYCYLRDTIPIVSAAVWAWVRLCSTPQSVEITGSEPEISRAQGILDDLDSRILENPYQRAKGVNRLTEAMFLDLFTLGRFCGELVLQPDGSGIDYFQTLDPFKVQWERSGKWRATYEEEDGSVRKLNPERTFYTTLGMDSTNPAGIEPLATVPFILEIEQKLLEDMARSSHNAGTPRLQVKITPPQAFENENEEEYLSRINGYFDQTVDQFQSLEADQNLFTWSDVEVTVVGGEKGRSFTWKVNREQILEDVITALKLFPWVLGRSHGTTQNWVSAQYNLLMQEVDSIQASATSLADWLRSTELKLRGCKAKAKHVFAPNQDPFQLERAQADETRFGTIDGMVEKGYITKDEGKRRLGV
ncbi:hypothetical protein CEE37_05270 [candidate division LCP-89 bacterium B3_LCP]|uniref:Phage portal protein n=1 Tax=candidate division LCP-89 bacterium B3_LCP TaxID=2012998 RepID=A0A532V1N3_UNCL8|nr:MAG: hypothetical protein CEE37_05270 [candidate division LCP-89 bacterium B3_LCP]